MDDSSISEVPSSLIMSMYTDDSISSAAEQPLVHDIAELHNAPQSPRVSPARTPSPPIAPPAVAGTIWITGQAHRSVPIGGEQNQWTRRPGHGQRMPAPLVQPAYIDDLHVQAPINPRGPALAPVHNDEDPDDPAPRSPVANQQAPAPRSPVANQQAPEEQVPIPAVGK